MALATGGATAISRARTRRRTSRPGASGLAAKNCTTTTTPSRARPSSPCASGSSISVGPRGPTDIELPLAQGELGRAREGVVVVVQFFAANPEAPGRDVRRRVRALEIAVAPPVANAIDEAGGPERDPDHLDRPDGQANDAKQRNVDDRHEGRAPVRVLAEQLALEPVVRRAAAVLLHVGLVVAGLTVEGDTVEEDLLDAEHLRAVRIFLGLDLRVVLAVDR